MSIDFLNPACRPEEAKPNPTAVADKDRHSQMEDAIRLLCAAGTAPMQDSSSEEFVALTSCRHPACLLLVGADPTAYGDLKSQLPLEHWRIFDAASGAAAWEMLAERKFDLLLLDPALPDLDGADFERMIRAEFPDLQIIILSQPTGMLSPATVCATSAARTPENHSRVLFCPESIPHPVPAMECQASGWYELLGGSRAMQRVYQAADLVARRSTTVLIQGESGTGKDLLARSLHAASARDRQPFVVINCAAIPEALLEAELFGYTKGSFTGAVQSRIGRIHAAHRGTLFLDEIGDMPYLLQSKILRFLEQGEVQKIGGTETLKVDCRVIAATNADLKTHVAAGRFREDLFYRLAVFPITLPPLRERLEDLPVLTDAFLARYNSGHGITEAACRLLATHKWPGNVRELRNVIERAAIFAAARRSIDTQDVQF